MSATGAPARPMSIRARLGLAAGLVAAQTALAWPGVSGPTLWIDEAYCAVLARRPIAGIHAALAHDSSPPLYYDLLHAWRAAFGESEAALRSLSLLLSCIVTGMLVAGAGSFLSTDRQRGHRAAIWAATFWALSPTALGYAHEVRNYALLAPLGLGLALAVLRFLADGGRRGLLAVVLLGTATVYTHNVGWVLLAALGLAALVVTRDVRHLVPLALAFLVVGVAYLPWVPTLLQQMQASDRFIGWVDPAWIRYGPLLTVASWLPGGARLPFVPYAMTAPLWVQIFDGALVLGAIAVACRVGAQPARMLGATIVVYVGALFAASLVWAPLLLAGRTDFVLLPLVACLLGAATALGRRGAVVGTVLAVQMLAVSVVSRTPPPGPDERPLASLLADRIGPGDLVVCTGLTRPAVAYVTGERAPILSYPQQGEERMGQFNPEYLESHLDLAAERETLLARVRSGLSRGADLWLVSSTHPFQRPLHRALDAAPFLEFVGADAPPDLGLRRYGEQLLVAHYRRR